MPRVTSGAGTAPGAAGQRHPWTARLAGQRGLSVREGSHMSESGAVLFELEREGPRYVIISQRDCPVWGVVQC